MLELSTQTILVVAGIIFIFFGIIGYIILPRKGLIPLKISTRICLGIISIVLLISGIFYSPQCFQIPIPPSISKLSAGESLTQFLKSIMVYSDVGIANGDI